MKEVSKKEVIKLIVLSAILFGFIGFVLISLKIRSNELEENPEYGVAVIVDIYVGAKAKDYVKYKFLAHGKIYTGHQHYLAHWQTVNIRDKCEVVYARTNPDISKLLTDADGLLKIK